MHHALRLLVLSVVLSACAQVSEVDPQATQKALHSTQAVETALAKTAVANATIGAIATNVASLPPIGELNEVCQGQPAPEAGSYSKTPGIHPVYFAGGGTLTRRFLKELPNHWRPGLISDAHIVACVDEVVELKELEVCRYGFASGFTQVTITRYRAALTVRLLEAKTGRVIDQEVFTKNGGECPSSTTQTFDSKIVPEFEYIDIKYWLGSFVSP